METNRNDAVQAIARGLLDGGVGAFYNYPGFLSHDIFRALGGNIISLNERAACAEAFGASLAGRRSVALFKNVGLNIASDAFLHTVIAGVNAGMTVIVTDDILVWGSQESQDSRPYYDFFGGLWLEPATLQEGYDFAKSAFSLSEEFDIPVVIRLTNYFFQLQGSVSRNEQQVVKHVKNINLKRKPEKFVVHPYYYAVQQECLAQKNAAIQKQFSKRVTPKPVFTSEKGLIVVGATSIPKECLNATDILQITTYPLPTEDIKEFLEAHSQITVLEAGRSYVEGKVKELSSQKDIVSYRPASKSPGTKFVKWKRYRRFFGALAAIKNRFVVSDITQFTVEELDTVDAALSLGVAVATAIGYAETQSDTYTFCLSGDSSFLHEGLGLIDEAIARGVKLGIVVFDNGGSWCTGGQKSPSDIHYVKNHKSLKKIYLDYEKDTDQIVERLQMMQTFDGVCILYLNIPFGSLSREDSDE